MAIRITRRNPRTGRTERPWRNRDGLFVLGDPAHGAQKHHDKFAVKVATLDEAAALVGRGFSLRMTDGETPPALISPDSLLVEEAADADPAPLFAETAPKPPFLKEDMMAELRRAFLVQANQIAHAGSLEFARVFIGFKTVNPLYPYCEDDPGRVDLTRFNATAYLDLAYDYAFQTGQHWRFGDVAAQDVREFVRGANLQASDGEQSPLADSDGLCRRAADAAFGRWNLESGRDLTVRELSLLAQMTEAAVRNSLSKERIAIDQGKIDGNTALVWLKQRRDFIPTRIDEGHKERWAAHARFVLDHRDFGEAFGLILKGYEKSAEEIAGKAGVSDGFIEGLKAGRPTADLEALRRVGEALELDAPHFVGLAVQESLRRVGSERTG